LFAANACVAAIKEGCELYKQAKTSFMEVKATVDEAVGIGKEIYGFWGTLAKLFGGAPTPVAPKPVAQKKKEKYKAYDETQATADIVKHLTKFWTLQDELNDFLRAEENRAKVYDPNAKNADMMASAMNRILCQQQMEKLSAEIREIMVYQTPGLADIYTQTYAMRGAIQEEQEKARLAKEAKERQTLWQQREKQRNLQAKLAGLLVTSIFLLYLWLWLSLLSRWRQT
jgi:hypothetical protein